VGDACIFLRVLPLLRALRLGGRWGMRARLGPRVTGRPSSMTIPHPSLYKNKPARFAPCWQRSTSLVLGLLGAVVPAHAWVTLDLPDLGDSPPAVAISHLSDGRFVYGNSNALYLQNSFGAAAVTTFATPPGVDPSFVTVLTDTTAMLGAGGGGPTSPVYQFNPSNPASPGYTAGAVLENFSAAPAGASSAYVVGSNGSGENEFGGNDSSVSYVTLAGQQQLLVNHDGGFSGGVAVDKAGNLFLGDDDNNSVYKFTAAQVQNAIAHATVLALGDGTLVHTFGADVIGSLAVDADGRVWAAGFGAAGLYWFNPATNNSGVFDPQDAAANPESLYSLSTFSANGSDYVGYVWQSGFDGGDSVVYGYDTVQNVPEPATTAWWAAMVALVAACCNRRRQTRQA